MILAVDPDRAVPVYEQVREQVVRMVVSGVLPVGSRLPTIRQLASDLGLAKGTVAKAYERLESDDWIETLGRKGSFVREQLSPSSLATDTDLDAAAEAMVLVARQLGVTRHEAQRAVAAMWDNYSG